MKCGLPGKWGIDFVDELEEDRDGSGSDLLVVGRMEGESMGRKDEIVEHLWGQCGNLVQCKLSGIYEGGSSEDSQ